MFKDKKMSAVGMLKVAFFLLLLVLTTPGTASAAMDMFVKIDGIQGASVDDRHKDWIEVLNYQFSVAQPTAGTAGTRGGAAFPRANFQDLKITKLADKSSPNLFLACADQTHIKEVTLELCRAGGDKVKFMEIKLFNVIISSYKHGGSAKGPESLPMEEISFDYGRITMKYLYPRRADGTGGGQVASGWDLTANKSVR